jgi:flagellar basal body rod protein FlgG
VTIGMIQAAQGLEASEVQFDRVAQNIAASPFSLATPQGDQVSLSTQAVALLQAKNSFEANIKLLQVDDQMTQTLLATLSASSKP